LPGYKEEGNPKGLHKKEQIEGEKQDGTFTIRNQCCSSVKQDCATLKNKEFV